MTNRLKELMKQAETECGFNPDKFAELIVLECVNVIFNGHFSDEECEGNSHRVSYNNGRFGASKDIKKHFGVEE